MHQDDKDRLTKSFNDDESRICSIMIAMQNEAYDTGRLRGKNDRHDRQAEILTWACNTFGKSIADNSTERIRRFFEEAAELAQAVGLEKNDVLALVDHVYAKPAGNVNQEIGQVGVSLLGLAAHLNIDADQEELDEFKRLKSLSPDYWKARQNAKADKGLGLRSTPEESCRSFG